LTLSPSSADGRFPIARIVCVPTLPLNRDQNQVSSTVSALPPAAKLKAALRKAAQCTVDELWDSVCRLVDAITPKECAHCFTACG
jgi:hypothetical protein